jgi:hypothetical protein
MIFLLSLLSPSLNDLFLAACLSQSSEAQGNTKTDDFMNDESMTHQSRMGTCYPDCRVFAVWTICTAFAQMVDPVCLVDLAGDPGSRIPESA